MPNKNYQMGVRLEREVIHEYQADGYLALRSAGSHSAFDVVAVLPGMMVDLVQCKVTKSEALARRLCREFADNPPLPLGPYRQIMLVKILRQHTIKVIIEALPTK